jgi:acetylornithine deacetylase/succinyl-diaminopimelate desuccinylase-like protein
MPDRDDVLKAIDEKEVIQVAKELVAIRSITHQEGMGMVEFYKKWFNDLKVPVRVYPHENDRANFFADFGTAGSGTGTPGAGGAPETAGRGKKYMFNGHQDTKPVTGMTIDPFGGEIRDGKMYGRGTADMKGAIAGVLCAIKAMVRAGKEPEGLITFYSDIDEEYGAEDGWYWAKDQGFFDGYDGLICCEPTELEIQIGNRGAFATAFAAKGLSAHSGLANLGINAVHHMVRFITEFLKLPYLQVENKYFGKSMVNFEKIEGGLYLAAVPDSCLACVDSRLIPETPPEVVDKQVNDLISRLKKENINIQEVDEPENWRAGSFRLKAESISVDDPLVKRAASAVEYATGEEARYGGCPAMTIVTVTIPLGIPSIIHGPGSIAQAHTEDEWVEIDQLVKACRSYAALMAEM